MKEEALQLSKTFYIFNLFDKIVLKVNSFEILVGLKVLYFVN